MSDQSIISLPYFGNINFYTHWIGYKPVIEAFENYQKKSWRNKTNILAANGELCLSVPLIKGKHGKRPYQSIEIAYYEDWVKNHIQAIQSAYGNAPYFDFYAPDLFDILNTKYIRLWDLNLKCLELCCSIMQCNHAIEFSATYKKSDSYANDFRNIKGSDNSIQLKTYHQVFEDKFGFIPNLSILDLIFNKGPECLIYLKSQSNNLLNL